MNIRFGTIVIVFLGITWTAQAQSDTSIGIRGGASLATLTGDGAEDVDLNRRVGLVAGAFLTYALTPQVAIQPEVLYSMKGAKFSEEFSGETVDATIKLDYIEIPILLRFDIATGSAMLPYVAAGPAVAFNTKAEVEAEVLGETETDDISDDIETIDVGLAIGGGMALTNSLSIDVRYTFGLLNVIADPEENEEELKNGSLSVTAAFTFRR